MTNNNLPEKVHNFVIFQTETGKVNIEVFFYNETLWLTQKKIAELFEKDRSVITKHLKNIFNEGELDEKVVCANFAHTIRNRNLCHRAVGEARYPYVYAPDIAPNSETPEREHFEDVLRMSTPFIPPWPTTIAPESPCSRTSCGSLPL